MSPYTRLLLPLSKRRAVPNLLPVLLVLGSILLVYLTLIGAIQRPYAMRLVPTESAFNHVGIGWNVGERATDGTAFRWSTGTATMQFRAAQRTLPANHPLILTMIIAARPPDAPVTTVTLLANGHVVDAWPSNVRHPVSLDVAPALRGQDDLTLALRTTPYSPARDTRNLGMPLLGEVRLAPAPGFALPSPTAVANVLGLVLCAALVPGRRVHRRWRFVVSGITLGGIAVGIVLARTPFWRVALPLVCGLAVAVATIWAPVWWAWMTDSLRTVQRRTRRTDRGVLAIGAVLTVVGQTLIALHRGMNVGTALLLPGLLLLLVPLLQAPFLQSHRLPGAGASATESLSIPQGLPDVQRRVLRPVAVTRTIPWSVIVLVGIAALAVALRVALITEMPASLFRDEGRHALRAVRILDDASYRPVYEPDIALPALFLYPLALTFKIFGVSLQTLRLFMATCGVLSVVLLYLLGQRLFGVRIGLIAAYLFAVSFWALRMQRVGLIPSFSAMLVLLALVLFARAAATRRYRDWALAGLAAAGCVNAYHSSPFVLVLLASVAAIWFVRGPQQFVREWLPRFALFAAVFLIGAAPLINYIVHHRAEYFTRPEQTAVFSEMNLRRLGQDPLAALTANVLPNLGMYTVRGDHEPKHDLPFAPQLDAVTAVCFLVGLAVALSGRPTANDRLGGRFVVGWLGAMLIPSLLAIDAPNTLRAFDTLPPVLLLAAIGLNALWVFLATPRSSAETLERHQLAPTRRPIIPALTWRLPLILVLATIPVLNAGTYFGLMRTDPRETLRFDEYFASQSGKQMVADAPAMPGMTYYIPRAMLDRDVFPFFARAAGGGFIVQTLETANPSALPAHFAIVLPNGIDDLPPDRVVAALRWPAQLQRIEGVSPAGANNVPAFIEYRIV